MDDILSPEQEDLMDELFPKVDISGNTCILQLVNNIIQGAPFNPEAFELAVNYLRSTIPNPIPTLVNDIWDTILGVISIVAIWVYAFFIFVILVLVWLLAAIGSLNWQVALIFTFFLLILTFFVYLIVKTALNSYISRRETIIEDYLTNWEETYVPLLPATLNQAICIYVYPPYGIPPEDLQGSKSSCGGCSAIRGKQETKKTV